MKLLWGMCGSFCNHAAVIEQLTDMVQRWPITMIVSENTAQLDTRFGTAKERLTQLERLTGKPVMTTLQEAERTGPIDHFDAMVIAPITATELNKLALGIYDTPSPWRPKRYCAIRNRWCWALRPMIFSVFRGLTCCD